jgi:hypothetical protein
MAVRLTQPLTDMSTRKCFWEVKRGRLLTQLHRYLCADCLENEGASTSHNPMGLHTACYGDRFLLSALNEVVLA